MSGSAGSKYGILQDGVPTTAKERVLQRINDISPKNCPYCGQSAEVVCYKRFIWFGRRRYYCECSNFECDVMPSTDSKDIAEEAVKVWNTRK